MSKTTPSNPIEDGLIQYVEVFQKDVNIKLFNDIIAFIAKTTDVETRPIYRDLSENHLWYSRSEDENIQEQYGFRYFGELLERFEDRTNADVKDIFAHCWLSIDGEHKASIVGIVQKCFGDRPCFTEILCCCFHKQFSFNKNNGA